MNQTIPNQNQMPISAAKSGFLKNFFNFDEFITTRLIKIIYIVGIILIPLAVIGSSAAMFLFTLFGGVRGELILQGFLQLIVSVIVSLLAILLLRVYCEFIIVVFKINENLQGIRSRNERF